MANASLQFRPDYAVPPGWILEERLEALEMSQADFAKRCDRSAKLISEIISGKAPVEPQTALQFEKVLGVSADIWLNLETRYQLKRARDAEAEWAEQLSEWAKSFPVSELTKRGLIEKNLTQHQKATGLLSFFGVASLGAWETKYSDLGVAYRHSETFESSVQSLSTWLRLGELATERQECSAYSAPKFKSALRKIRELTREDVETSIPKATKYCNAAGVALVFVKPMPKTALSGAAWWQSSHKAVIQLSLRHKTDDHLWFSFFHEAAHILLHRKKENNLKNVFVDNKTVDDDPIEVEANEWASSFLIEDDVWNEFVSGRTNSAKRVKEFADEIGICPGIIVGRLQKERRIAWSHLNGLKVKLEWAN